MGVTSGGIALTKVSVEKTRERMLPKQQSCLSLPPILSEDDLLLARISAWIKLPAATTGTIEGIAAATLKATNGSWCSWPQAPTNKAVSAPQPPKPPLPPTRTQAHEMQRRVNRRSQKSTAMYIPTSFGPLPRSAIDSWTSKD